LDRWRLWNLRLLIAGALLGVIAGQTWLPDNAAPVCAGASAAVLAAATWIQQKQLGKDRIQRWTTARAASETLKAATHWYLAGVAPYDNGDRDVKLQKVLGRVDEEAEGFQSDYLLAPTDSVECPAYSGVAAYVTERAEDQRNWHAERVETNEKNARRLRAAESIATAVAAILAAVAAANADLVAWVGLATTVGAAFGAHLLAAQYDKLATTYAWTSTQLTRLIDQRTARPLTPESEAEFVCKVEEVLSTQNEGWVALLNR
jgi:hypothetical protein